MTVRNTPIQKDRSGAMPPIEPNFSPCTFSRSSSRVPHTCQRCGVREWRQCHVEVQSVRPAQGHHHLEGARRLHPQQQRTLQHLLQVCSGTALLAVPGCQPHV